MGISNTFFIGFCLAYHKTVEYKVLVIIMFYIIPKVRPLTTQLCIFNISNSTLNIYGGGTLGTALSS